MIEEIPESVITEALEAENLGDLHDLLYEAARNVLWRWGRGSLDPTIRDLGAVIRALDALHERHGQRGTWPA